MGQKLLGSTRRKTHPWFVGEAPEADNVSGSITVPEVAHDTEESEYVVCSLL